MDLLRMLVVAGGEEVHHRVELVDFGLLQGFHGGARDLVGHAVLEFVLSECLCGLG